MTKRIPLTEAALQLGIDYQQCRRMMLSRHLRGGRDEYGRLYVEYRSLARALRTARKGDVRVSTEEERS